MKRTVYLLLALLPISLFLVFNYFTISHTTETSFYYWKTVFELNNSEKSYLKQLNVKSLNVRFFDVDWDDNLKTTYPLGVINNLNPIANIEIIPTIFITNKTLYHIKESQIPNFCKNVTNKIFSIYDSSKIKQIQFDCDWTERTKGTYFSFLNEFKQNFPNLNFSVTIRLHQIKFKDKTGVPPVKSGMLMVYNLDKIGDANTHNSILDLKSFEMYIAKLSEYPLKLDIALPIFSQGVLLRNTKAMYLIQNINKSDLENTNEFKKIDNVHFKSINNHYFYGNYIYKNDIIRYENVGLAILKQVAQKLKNRIKNKNLKITYFHLDSINISKIKYNEIQDINNNFH
ncbi:MAG: hypothetical protein NTW25_12965 [Candidatus Kapabacteria bacterium]|nr:hypothetical protein [Candidatus Kapabacteria bacterium]